MRLSPLTPPLLLATLALLAGPAHAEENECRRTGSAPGPGRRPASASRSPTGRGCSPSGGGATWGAGDPERARRGGVHIGAFAGTVAPQGAAASFAVGENGALPVETGDASDCKVWLRRVGPWLVVDDNLACGGVNVTFSGLYRRQP